MKLAPVAAAILLLGSVAAAAQPPAGKTREQVLAELAEARRMGETIAPGCGGGTLREAFPERYRRPAVASTTSLLPGPGGDATQAQRTDIDAKKR